MRYDDILKHWGNSLSDAAAAIGLRRQTVHKWKATGIPEKWQLEIELLTGGKLKADPAIKREFLRLLGLPRDGLRQHGRKAA